MSHPAGTADFWNERWKTNQIGFHEGAPNAHLRRHWTEHVPKGGRVLVPLCGKSHDMVWLAERGHGVVGVELSERACNAFFQERKLRPRRSVAGPFIARQRGPYTLFQGDIFDLNDQFEAIWDRAALVALPPELRPRYAAHMRASLRPGGVMLLVTFSYDQAKRDGPPFSVPTEEVQRLYPGAELLDRAEVDEERWRPIGGLVEEIWKLRV